MAVGANIADGWVGAGWFEVACFVGDCFALASLFVLVCVCV